MRLEEEARQDPERAPAAQPRQVLVQALRQDDVHDRAGVLRERADVLENGIAEAAGHRPVVDRQAEVVLRPLALAEMHGPDVVGADAARVLGGTPRRVVEVAREDADEQLVGHAPLGAP